MIPVQGFPLTKGGDVKKLVSVLALLALCSTAYAGFNQYSNDDRDKWTGMCNSVGGFLYNTLPWNWDFFWRQPEPVRAEPALPSS